MKLKVCYTDDNFLNDIKSIKEKYKDIEIEGYSEEIYSEKSKAFRLKGSFSARETPFMALYNDKNKPIRVFYSEVSECNLDNLTSFLNNYNNENQSN